MLLIEMNEVNFDYVRAYGRENRLPTLNRLIDDHGLIETISEKKYENLEPWIQWVTAHTGLSFDEHGIFRLGDIVEAKDIEQIWEVLERSGISVGAISPINASNKCLDPAFFIPDPWTNTTVKGSAILQRLSAAINQTVNDNAKNYIDLSSYFWVAIGALRYSKIDSLAAYLSIASNSRTKPWMKAILLDRLLAEVFRAETLRTHVEFASLFLNAAAHIQHHYMFNAAVYRGSQVNPDWYVSRDADPILEVYSHYDKILAKIEKTFPGRRLLIATGLHQNPYNELKYYWRLDRHADFLDLLGIEYEQVEARMSRDFVVYCSSVEIASRAAQTLNSICDDAGNLLFEVDNRGTSLFVMLIYPKDIPINMNFYAGGKQYRGLRDHVAFVAIKNGEHNGTGYLIDTSQNSNVARKSLPLGAIFHIVSDHFTKSRNPNIEPYTLMVNDH